MSSDDDLSFSKEKMDRFQSKLVANFERNDKVLTSLSKAKTPIMNQTKSNPGNLRGRAKQGNLPEIQIQRTVALQNYKLDSPDKDRITQLRIKMQYE